MSRIAFGVRELLNGFRFFINNRRLWWYAVIPTFINILILILATYIIFNFYDDIFRWLEGLIGISQAKFGGGFWSYIWGALAWVVSLFVKAILFIVFALLILLSTYMLAFIIASPFNDLLSERVEEMITGSESPPFTLRSFVENNLRVVKVESLKAVFFIAFPVCLFVLNLLPVIGSIIYSIFAVLFGAWGLGFSYVDYPMGRRPWGFRRRISFARKYYLELIGLGIIFIIPFFAFIFTAPLTAAGTGLFLKLTYDPTKTADI